MNSGFDRHYEAQRYADTLTESRVQVALGIIHHAILETGGTQLQLLSSRYSPIHTLDVLYFYKTVARLFTEWTEGVRVYPEVPGNQERLLRLPEATALIPTLLTSRARVGLTNYLSILRNTLVPEGTFVDALLCSRLVSIVLCRPELLDRILNGDESWAAINPWEGVD